MRPEEFEIVQFHFTAFTPNESVFGIGENGRLIHFRVVSVAWWARILSRLNNDAVVRFAFNHGTRLREVLWKC